MGHGGQFAKGRPFCEYLCPNRKDLNQLGFEPQCRGCEHAPPPLDESLLGWYAVWTECSEEDLYHFGGVARYDTNVVMQYLRLFQIPRRDWILYLRYFRIVNRVRQQYLREIDKAVDMDALSGKK